MSKGFFGYNGVRLFAILVLALLLLPAKVGAESSPDLIKAAKAEGELVLYTAMQRKVIKDSVEMFQKKYGIKVTYVRKGSGGTIQLIEAERKTKAYKADVVDLWDPATFRYWKKQGLFMAYKPAGGDKIAKNLIDSDWDIVTASPITEVIVYNTRAVKADALAPCSACSTMSMSISAAASSLGASPSIM